MRSPGERDEENVYGDAEGRGERGSARRGRQRERDCVGDSTDEKGKRTPGMEDEG